MQSTSGLLLWALIAGLMARGHARGLLRGHTRSACTSEMLLALGLPNHQNLTIRKLAEEVSKIKQEYQAEDNITEEMCNKTRLPSVCFPIKSAQCDDYVTGCAIYEGMNISETWLERVGNGKLVCKMEFARSGFKDHLIPGVHCESVKVKVIHVKTTYEEKCLMLEVLNELFEYLVEYIKRSKPSRISHPFAR